MGSITSAWDHYSEWRRINDEGEEGVVSLETAIRGTCDQTRLLDIVENFLLYEEQQGGLAKLVAKNHQYLGANRVFDELQRIRPQGTTATGHGRLGVFWHTQGSGKSYSMVFFSQKVLRKLPGGWTFLVVTDRKDLDTQIYKNFANTGTLNEPEDCVRARDAEHLAQLLHEDHRYVFTLIQKFRTEQRGEVYPMLTDRSDIIVMADEAHRSQYDTFALNMRNALPHAAYIGFTGTPLMAGEERTREVFGDYISIYNFKRSADEGATVPLYYENRIPELQLTNDDLNTDIYDVLNQVDAGEDEEKALEREFAREYHVITRDDRLEEIAQDIVAHFMGRKQRGKAMVVSIDKATAVKMYDKVQKHWRNGLDDLRRQVASAANPEERAVLQDQLTYLAETDMAVVVSSSQNEVADLRDKHDVDIVPHRRRMNKENLETAFKDSKNPLRIVFVCAMWMTGFDVKSCNTIYLDKPMRNHTLMQTIARANRVFGDKVSGLIVDYIGVFRNLKAALAIYGSASGGGIKPGDMPVEAKSKLVDRLRQTLADVRAFCGSHGVDFAAFGVAEGFQVTRLLRDAVEALVADNDTRTHFQALAGDVARLYKAILPDTAANEFGPDIALIGVIVARILALQGKADIDRVAAAINQVLDQSVAARRYVITAPLDDEDRRIDLSKLDFEALKKEFAEGYKHTAIERLRGALNSRLQKMVRLNRSRMNYLERFQQMIDENNAAAHDTDVLFEELLAFSRQLDAEEQRAIGENLSEEELAVFDLLTQPDHSLTGEEEQRVKEIAHDLLVALKNEKLVLDWRKRQQARAAVRLAIEETLDRLPDSYSKDDYDGRCEAVYLHIYESYFGSGRSVYAQAA